MSIMGDCCQYKAIYCEIRLELYELITIERTKYRYLLEKKIPKMKQEFCNVVVSLQMLPVENEKEKANNEGSMYHTRSGERSNYLMRMSSTATEKSILSDTTGTIHKESGQDKRFELTSKQEVVFKAYHLLRSIAIDIRLYVGSLNNH